ncbi:Cys/Met metabolism pyridoxal-phosphate-dependent protein [Emticicia oligotrophica DSM 17448]|uniref:Cys/Met metabolism pyridoxal-phosphate-dependent protein n=1 Tax=Emticicia oligotrophica (strain DSM 17448 / CIP 109782 / MTCC 6937 / GPTSA100-15) TaxID=929562 RepID=A0ABM5N771_EMTOG|nr:aminotransferase class I/II-fold pyridoxal phosphate-dependent enzyme [Emticicia oligotrophica]AFK05348.1 Cys/Met metabolism pyridoxal-phosphate-dependent protein [Emticicia oligotrophica DSM 17448]
MNQSFIINQLAEERESYFNAVAPPIIQTSNFAYPTVDEFKFAIENEKEEHIYTRGNNPTVDMLCKKMAALEGAEDCLMVGSGAAAISNAVISQINAGEHIISVRNPYTWANHLMTKILTRFNVETTFVDGTNIENFIKACRPNTKLIYLESPNSWTFELQDLKGIAEFAKSKGIITIIDNSYCTALCQKPLEFGIDLVVYSATKYYNGHSDVVAGAICGSREKISQIFHNEFMTLGNILSPQNAWLMLRSLRTLSIRLKQSSETTLKVIDFLKNSDKIEQLWYPFSNDNPQIELAQRQMKMPMGMFTVSFKEKRVDKIKKFCESLQNFLIAVSWGGHESLIMPKCAFVSADDPQVSMLRFYIGLEEASTLIDDLEKNLAIL